uniref:SRCR domain-containing protein n=1 Tax=Amphimedon queenslandica TaxID=400682 RepID=A0A1X7T643_AMPQE
MSFVISWDTLELQATLELVVSDYLSIKWDEVNCVSSSYLSIAQCTYSTIIDSDCGASNSYDATVFCYTTRIWNSNPYAGMVRLQGGYYSNEGRVEVYCNGQWGTICSIGFSASDANTICRQLGYDSGLRKYDSIYGNTSQPIWSTNMYSTSGETFSSKRYSTTSKTCSRLISDYYPRALRITLPAFANSTCDKIGIINHTIREQLFENFIVEIANINSQHIGLTVDHSPSTIRIQDDDSEVRFAIGQATFSEGGGNQSITVILGGGQLSQSEDVEVYIDDGTTKGTSLGFVTFGTGAVLQNRTVVFPVVDNKIALEPDKHYILRLRNIGNI